MWLVNKQKYFFVSPLRLVLDIWNLCLPTFTCCRFANLSTLSFISPAISSSYPRCIIKGRNRSHDCPTEKANSSHFIKSIGDNLYQM